MGSCNFLSFKLPVAYRKGVGGVVGGGGGGGVWESGLKFSRGRRRSCSLFPQWRKWHQGPWGLGASQPGLLVWIPVANIDTEWLLMWPYEAGWWRDVLLQAEQKTVWGQGLRGLKVTSLLGFLWPASAGRSGRERRGLMKPSAADQSAKMCRVCREKFSRDGKEKERKKEMSAFET